MAGSPLEARLRDDLKIAMKARDSTAVTALRTALAALANAEAVPVAEADQGGARQVTGEAAGDVARLDLSEEQRLAVLRAHLADRQATIDELRTHGQADAADELAAELATLERYLTP